MFTQPKKLVLVGFFLVLFGFVGPWLMVLNYVKSTLFFNFLSYGSSVAGLILGIIGAAMWSGIRRKDDE